MKSVLKLLGLFLICGSFYSHGYWVGTNQNADVSTQVLRGLVVGLVAGLGFTIRRD